MAKEVIRISREIYDEAVGLGIDPAPFCEEALREEIRRVKGKSAPDMSGFSAEDLLDGGSED